MACIFIQEQSLSTDNGDNVYTVDGNVQVPSIPVSQFVQHHTSQFKSAHKIFIV